MRKDQIRDTQEKTPSSSLGTLARPIPFLLPRFPPSETQWLACPGQGTRTHRAGREHARESEPAVPRRAPFRTSPSRRPSSSFGTRSLRAPARRRRRRLQTPRRKGRRRGRGPSAAGGRSARPSRRRRRPGEPGSGRAALSPVPSPPPPPPRTRGSAGAAPGTGARGADGPWPRGPPPQVVARGEERCAPSGRMERGWAGGPCRRPRLEWCWRRRSLPAF